MCGICGLADPLQSLNKAERNSFVVAMSSCLTHRGPDGEGTWVDDHCTLGHRRLSVIDQTAGGNQPQFTNDENFALTFNGEIYNYLELREELRQAGVEVSGESDTAVLLTGLVLEGAAFLERVDGMYALAFWNARDCCLLLARDFFGEKPLYWSRVGECIGFASELVALHCIKGFDTSIDQDALASFLMLQYIPPHLTIYKHAHSVEPGSRVMFYKDGSSSELPRTRLESLVAEVPATLNRQADSLEELLLVSLGRRLRSDVPIGAFLSGGIDSALVVALCARHLNRCLDVFTIGFSKSITSEHLQAGLFAKHLNLRHIFEVMDPPEVNAVTEVASFLDQPNGDSSCFPTWRLSQLARRSVKVCLSGDGGDELFAGYDRYRDVIQRGSTSSSSYPTRDMNVYSSDEVKRLMGSVPKGARAYLESINDQTKRNTGPLVHRLRITDARSYLPGAVLAKVDRMSMQQGLEVRTPFLQKEVAAFANGLPPSSLVSGANGKVILRVIAARYFPKEWIDRPKMGFAIPVWSWPTTAVVEIAATLLKTSSRLAELISAKEALAILEQSDDRRLFYKAWSIIILGTWLELQGIRSPPSRRRMPEAML